MVFRNIQEVDANLVTQDDFDNSDFAGADKLLGVKFNECLFACTKFEEDVADNYYFLESNSDMIPVEDDDMKLAEMDGIRFVLIDFYGGEYCIAVKKIDAEVAQNMF